MKDVQTLTQKLHAAVDALNQEQLREVQNFVRKLQEENKELDSDKTHKKRPLLERD